MTGTLASFLFGLVPAVLFFGLYALRSNWRGSEVGRAVFSLAAVVAASYLLGMAVLVWPGFFAEPPGYYTRFVLRVVIGLVLWNLVRVVWRAQRRDRASRRPERPSSSS